ncbi:MAG: enoyl-CoA hydratase/isomerase family protein [Proteobacteria bacterium]|nr:enoyl-CoA hydratase/isomerase family protein [Pseudomonadota bacterium]
MANDIIIKQRGRVLRICLNRPDKLNALSSALFSELNPILAAGEQDDGIGAMIITGSGRAFAAGADVAEMHTFKDHNAAREADFISGLWEQVSACGKPVIAAVNGLALGGGCELAMMCDFIIAGESAQFAQPEIKLGTIPGIGGTQRLTRAIGKAKAMELCLTGRMMCAEEAEYLGLVVRVVADDVLEQEVWKTADIIASYSLPVTKLAKEAVNAADEMPLTEGIQHERQLFYSTFALQDRAEGMAAFLEKRPPHFKHK